MKRIALVNFKLSERPELKLGSYVAHFSRTTKRKAKISGYTGIYQICGMLQEMDGEQRKRILLYSLENQRVYGLLLDEFIKEVNHEKYPGSKFKYVYRLYKGLL